MNDTIPDGVVSVVAAPPRTIVVNYGAMVARVIGGGPVWYRWEDDVVTVARHGAESDGWKAVAVRIVRVNPRKDGGVKPKFRIRVLAPEGMAVNGNCHSAERFPVDLSGTEISFPAPSWLWEAKWGCSDKWPRFDYGPHNLDLVDGVRWRTSA